MAVPAPTPTWMQFESDLIEHGVGIASNDEMSGLGAAWTCGIALAYTWDVVDTDDARGVVEPSMPPSVTKIDGWRHAVRATMAYVR